MGNLFSDLLPNDDEYERVDNELLRHIVMAKMGIKELNGVEEEYSAKLNALASKIRTAHEVNNLADITLLARQFTKMKRSRSRMVELSLTLQEILSHLMTQRKMASSVIPGLHAVAGAMEYTQHELPQSEQEDLITQLKEGLQAMNNLTAGLDGIDAGDIVSGGGSGAPSDDVEQVLAELNLDAHVHPVVDDLQRRLANLKDVTASLDELKVPTHEPKKP